MAPGPAPSPPRRQESGYGPRSTTSFPAPPSEADILTERYDEDLEEDMPTAGGLAGEESTLNRGPVTVPREREREMVQASPRGRANVMHGQAQQVPFEDETQARSVDDPILETVRRETAAVQQRAAAKADFAVPYEALPSLEVRAPFDSFEAAFSERDPVTQAAGFPERDPVTRAVARRDDSAAYNAPESSERQPPPRSEEEYWGRREDSGPRSRPVPVPPQSYAQPVRGYDEPSLPWGEPPPPAQPSQPAQQQYTQGYSEMPPAQNQLRTATPDAWGTPQAPAQQGYLPGPMQPMQPMYVAMPGYGMAANQFQPQMMPQQGYYPAMQQQQLMQQQIQMQPQMQMQQPQMQQPQQGYAPQPGQPRLPSPSGAVSSPSRPVNTRTTSTRASGMTVGRFAWFVAGSAFGITFAFFATGFFFGGNKAAKEELAPAVQLQLPATVAQPVAAPVPMAPVAPAVAAPVVIAPVAPAVVAPVAPAAPAPVAAAPVAPTNLPNAAAAPAPAPAPAQPRFVARPARQPAPPRRPAPQSASDDAPAPAPAPAPKPEKAEKPAGGGDVSDLLGAGLKP